MNVPQIRRLGLVLVGLFILLITLFPLSNLWESEEATFGCAINCMDGRTQEPVRDYLKKTYEVTYVDMVTEPGPAGILSKKKDGCHIASNIKKRVGISVAHHKAKVIALVAHEGCAGNPFPKEEQLAHLREAKKVIESFGFQGKEVILLWVDAKKQVTPVQ